jgi:hypothetical protein
MPDPRTNSTVYGTASNETAPPGEDSRAAPQPEITMTHSPIDDEPISDERALTAAARLALLAPLRAGDPIAALDRACEAAGLDPRRAEDRARLIDAVDRLPREDWMAAVAIAWGRAAR